MHPVLLTVLVAVHPGDGATDVPLNSRIAVEYDQTWLDPSALAGPIGVAVNGTSREGAIEHVGAFLYGGLGAVVHGRYLDVFTPQTPFSEGDSVVVTLSTASFPTRGAVMFTVGSAVDLDPPTGGQIAYVRTFESESTDDDAPDGNDNYYQYDVTFEPASDGAGPAFILLDVTSMDEVGQPLEAPFVVKENFFQEDGVNARLQGRLRLASQAEDLAGNRGELRESSVRAPSFGDSSGCQCALDGSREKCPLSLGLVPCLLASLWVHRRIASRRTLYLSAGLSRPGSGGAASRAIRSARTRIRSTSSCSAVRRGSGFFGADLF